MIRILNQFRPQPASARSSGLSAKSRLIAPAVLASLIATTALPARASTVYDDFIGTTTSAPAGWTDMNLDTRGSLSESGGFLSITDARGNNPHLLQSQTLIGSITAYRVTVDVASTSGQTDSNGKVAEPVAITAVGRFNGFALVVMFEAANKRFTAFVNGQRRYDFTLPNGGSIPAYNGGALSFVVDASLDRFSVSCPTYSYASGPILFSSAVIQLQQGDTSPDAFPRLNTLLDLGADAGFILGAESGGSTVDGTLATVVFDRVDLNATPAAPALPGNTITDDFIGNSNGIPAAWTDFGPDKSGAVVESGTVVSITDNRAMGGPHFLQSRTAIPQSSAFTLRINVASATSYKDINPLYATSPTAPRSEPQVMTVVGGFSTYALIVQFNTVTKTFGAFVKGPTDGAYTFNGSMPAYNGGPLAFVVQGTDSHFSISCPAYGYSSGDLTFSSANVAGFTKVSDFGAGMGLLFGTECAGSVMEGTPATIAYDRVDLDTTPVNAAPTAKAGADQAIHAGSIVTLDGSASFDDNTASASLGYAWNFSTQPAGSTATLSNPASATPSFVADKAGDYVLDLVVTDAQGLKSGVDSVTISSNNQAPTAVATVDSNVPVVGNTVHFSAAGSTDPDNDTLTYAWAITAAPTGSTAALSGATTATPSLQVDKEGSFKVTLTVSDFLGAGAPTTLEVVATQPATNPEVQIVNASSIVDSLTAAKMTTKGNQIALGNFLKQATRSLQTGDVAGAISKLNEVLVRCDGFTLRGKLDGDGPSRDWIVDRQAQLDVYNLVSAALSVLTH